VLCYCQYLHNLAVASDQVVLSHCKKHIELLLCDGDRTLCRIVSTDSDQWLLRLYRMQMFPCLGVFPIGANLVRGDICLLSVQPVYSDSHTLDTH
jgi:hypothetical protein